MPTTVYVIDPYPDERRWMESALARLAENIVFLDNAEVLLGSLPESASACLIASADADQAATLKLVRDLRVGGAMLPVIVLGPYTAFRTAVDIARLEATDFLERPVSVRQLRTAVRRAIAGLK